MIVLEPTRMHWIRDDGSDDSYDLCVHSPVRFEIDSHVLIRPEDGDWAVSTSALYLLRTLTDDRAMRHGDFDDQVFPHCGHVFAQNGDDPVFFIGCSTGIDLASQRVECSVRLQLSNGAEAKAPMAEWREAVIAFARTVNSFYEGSTPKIAEDPSDASAFVAFTRELSARLVAV
jgi:hypothetical protein